MILPLYVFLEFFFSLSVRFCFGVFFAKSQKWRLGEMTASFTLVKRAGGEKATSRINT